MIVLVLCKTCFSQFLQKYKLTSDLKYLPLNADYQVTSVHNLYMLGVASHAVDYRESSGGFIHGFRYTGE